MIMIQHNKVFHNPISHPFSNQIHITTGTNRKYIYKQIKQLTQTKDSS